MGKVSDTARAESEDKKNGNGGEITQEKIISDDKEKIQSIINEYNNTVKNSYSGIYDKIDRSLFNNDNVFEELNSKNGYIASLYESPSVTNIDQKIEFIKIDIKEDLARVQIKRELSIQTEGDNTKEQFKDDEAYLLQKVAKNWKIVNAYINEMGNTDEFTDYINANVSDLKKYLHLENVYTTNESYKSLFSNVDEIKAKGKEIIEAAERKSEEFENIQSRSIPAFNYSKEKAAQYAEDYAYSTNSYYGRVKSHLINIPLYGQVQVGPEADCTNFASQAIEAGGMSQNNQWFHTRYAPGFSPEWIRVGDLRNYLINNGLAKGYWKSLPSYPSGKTARGSLVQFCSPEGV